MHEAKIYKQSVDYCSPIFFKLSLSFPSYKNFQNTLDKFRFGNRLETIVTRAPSWTSSIRIRNEAKRLLNRVQIPEAGHCFSTKDIPSGAN